MINLFLTFCFMFSASAKHPTKEITTFRSEFEFDPILNPQPLVTKETFKRAIILDGQLYVERVVGDWKGKPDIERLCLTFKNEYWNVTAEIHGKSWKKCTDTTFEYSLNIPQL